MFKRIMTLTIVAAGLIPQLGMAQNLPDGCTDSAQFAGEVERGIEAIRNTTGNDEIELVTKFEQTQARKNEGEFRVYFKRNGELHVDTNMGDFPATICRTSSGIKAHIYLSGLQAMAAGTDHVIIELQGDASGFLLVKSNLQRKANEPEVAIFKPIF